jgi:hypothetical protein
MQLLFMKQHTFNKFHTRLQKYSISYVKISQPNSYAYIGDEPWLRHLVAGLLPRKRGLSLTSAMWDLWQTKCQGDNVFPQYFSFPLSVPFHCSPAYSFIYHRHDVISASDSVIK